MIIQTNVSALNAAKNAALPNKAAEKLASGYKINQAADDAAGLAISEKIQAQILGLNQASENVQDGISFVQTAEGGLSEIHGMLHRVRELAVKTANGTNTNTDRSMAEKEAAQLLLEMDRITEHTEYNTIKVLKGGYVKNTISYQAGTTDVYPGFMSVHNDFLDFSTVKHGSVIKVEGVVFQFYETGTVTDPSVTGINIAGANPAQKAQLFKDAFDASALAAMGIEVDLYQVNDSIFDLEYSNYGLVKPVTDPFDISYEASGGKRTTIRFQIGADSGNELEFEMDNVSAKSLGISELTLLTIDSSQDAIKMADDAIGKVSAYRSKLGAVQNRFEHAYESLTNNAENLTSTNSRIRDADYAKEVTRYIKQNIMTQTAQTSLVHAIKKPESILELLK